ncbi:ROK family protein [Devosia albogilva]|uniref:ROK family protein n=1 Tax=Devosia albogilva TaxID=429726 RepID=A0ABW5QL35_9HYPH
MSSLTEELRDAFDVRGRGLQPQGLRRANERAVLTVIAFYPGFSNAEIARRTGLAPQTVSAILADCEQAGLIERGEVLRGRRGQPATPIFLRADGAFGIGVEIGWRHAEVLLLDLHAQVRSRQRLHYAYPDATTIMTALGTAIAALRAELPAGAQARLADIGVALPGEMLTGLDRFGAPPEQAALWAELDLASELQAQTGLEVSILDCGSAAAWAQVVHHPPPRPSRFIHFFLGNDIAAARLAEGVEWEGPFGAPANLGDMLVSDSRGQLQPAHQLASLSSLAALAGPALPAHLPPHEWTYDELGPVLDLWIDQAASALATVIYNTTTVAAAGLAIVDGLLPAPVLHRLIEVTERALAGLPVGSRPVPRLGAGHLGAVAAAVGAAELPIYRRYFSRAFADIAA